MDLRRYLKTQQWVPYPIELVFAYFANPHNLPGLMPKWQTMRLEEATIVAPPPRPLAPNPSHRLRTVAAGKGSSITFSFRPLPYSPLRLPWESRITEFAWNELFVDVAARSPFSFWEHHHLFETETRANEAGVPVQGTLIKDELEYESPGGEGRVVQLFQKQIVHRMVQRIFRAREEKLIKILPVVLGRLIPPPNT